MTVFNERDLQKLLDRIRSITEERKPLWGIMNATEMMHHCATAVRLVMHAEPNNKSTSLMQYLVRFYFMQVASRLPRNATAPKTLDVKKSLPALPSFP